MQIGDVDFDTAGDRRLQLRLRRRRRPRRGRPQRRPGDRRRRRRQPRARRGPGPPPAKRRPPAKPSRPPRCRGRQGPRRSSSSAPPASPGAGVASAPRRALSGDQRLRNGRSPGATPRRCAAVTRRSSTSRRRRRSSPTSMTLPRSAAMAERARRSCSTSVGPYTLYGEPVIEACIAGGAHYADLTGEIRLRAADDRRDRDERAVAAGVKIVNVSGFEALPADLAWSCSRPRPLASAGARSWRRPTSTSSCSTAGRGGQALRQRSPAAPCRASPRSSGDENARRLISDPGRA